MCQTGATGALAHRNMCKCHTHWSPGLVGRHVLAHKGFVGLAYRGGFVVIEERQEGIAATTRHRGHRVYQRAREHDSATDGGVAAAPADGELAVRGTGSARRHPGGSPVSSSASLHCSAYRGLMLRPRTTDMFEKGPDSRALGVRPLPLQKARGMDPVHRVLIIDDDAVNRRVAQALFQKLGWEVEAVDNGARGLLSLASHCPDLVLLDISMPGMNGIDVCQRIRADQALAGVRVIAYTAHVLPEQQQRFLAGGFDGVLVKPISVRSVQELLLAQTPCP